MDQPVSKVGREWWRKSPWVYALSLSSILQVLLVLHLASGWMGGSGVAAIEENRGVILLVLVGLVLAPVAVDRLKRRAFTRRVKAGVPPVHALARSYRRAVTDGWSGTVSRDSWHTIEARKVAASQAPPPSAHRQHQIASLTKVFTALALCDLVTKGEVALDDRLSRFGFDGRLGEVTFLELATHTSGLSRLALSPGSLPRLVLRHPDPYHGSELHSSSTLKRANRSISERRRGQDSYSNFGFDLLGEVLGSIDGSTAEDVLHDRVTRPLGMTGTGPIGQHPHLTQVRAHCRYGLPTPKWTGLMGAGGLSSTAADLRLLLRAYLEPSACALEDAVRLSLEFEAKDSKGKALGLPWAVHGNVLWHSGGTYGETSAMAVDRTRGRAAVLLTDQGLAFGTVQGVFKLLSADS